MIPILVFAAAGALLGGGAGGGWHLWQRGKGASAADLQKQEREHLRTSLEDEIDLADLKKRAAAAGVDVAAVLRGYQALKDKQLDPNVVFSQMMNGEAVVPTNGRGPSEPGTLPEGIQGASAAQIRRWARSHGLDVKPTGQIPRNVREAYAEARKDDA